MAALPCKVEAQVAFNAGGGVFYYIMAHRPHHLAKVSPSKIQSFDLHHGDHETNGAILMCKYTFDGKEQSCKLLIQDVEKEKKQIGYKVVEGDLLKLYKNMDITIHVETKEGIDFITWTIDYKLLDPESPHPSMLLNFFIELSKDIKAHIFGFQEISMVRYRSSIPITSYEIEEANEDELPPETRFQDESLVKILLRIESKFDTAKLAAQNSANELKALNEEVRKWVIADKQKASMQTDKFSKELIQVSTTVNSLHSNFSKSIYGENEFRQEVYQRLDHQSSRISHIEDSMALMNEQIQSALQKLTYKKPKSDDRNEDKGLGQRRRSRDKNSPAKKKNPALVVSTRGISRSLFGC